jgi:hypothetical protein
MSQADLNINRICNVASGSMILASAPFLLRLGLIMIVPAMSMLMTADEVMLIWTSTGLSWLCSLDANQKEPS